MKKILIGLLLSIFLSTTANALPWVPEVLNTFEDDNAEELYVDIDNDGLLDVGDTLRGVMNWFQLTIPQPTNYSLPANGIELSGLFEVEVIGKTLVGSYVVDADDDGVLDDVTAPGYSGPDFATDMYSYTFGPSASFQAELGLGTTNAVATFYLDSSPDLNVQNDDPTSAYANATDGSLYWVFGVEGLNWQIDAAPEDVSIFHDVLYQVTVAETTIGLEYLEGFGSGPALLPFNIGQFQDIELWAELALEGTSELDSATGDPTGVSVTEFDLLSNIQAKIKPIPEPSTMLLLGIGLLSASAAARRRKD